VEAQDNDKLFVKAVLEQPLDNEHFRQRKLEMLVFKSDLADAQQRAAVLGRIRKWIETTDGNGFLDLVSQPD
jgi:hypothetical protein